MKVKKMIKPANRQDEPAIYIHSMGMHLNAAARDALKMPEFISVELENNKIILSIGNQSDYKVSYSDRFQQKISGALFQSGYLSKIPNKTKIYGIYKNGKLEFEIPEEYINR